ncbi:hypothetical protein [Arthrobacter sp. STN4]|uniref:hypothetical protein n=1 Tax=Arthrobacter sp. STN4 TaxID=2923276 RepID=UPI002119CC13|nr:hypothetical protein [Arthrobacter sp. STN4]MCQ9163953.1 hypothetical protein [Arthrobacter sp. STN4]
MKAKTEQPLVPRAPFALTPEEVRQLWSFVHGDIMDGGTRQYLRGSLGLCPRHAWGHAVVEIELWQAGAGLRGGHQPFDVSVLYEDLLEYAAGELRKPLSWIHPGLAHQPTRSGACRICQELTGPLPDGLRMGYANSNSAALAVEANELTYTTAWCRETRSTWFPGVCPTCLGNDGADPLTLCRWHLTAHGPISRDTGYAVADRLLEIRQRLLRLVASMTDHGEPATAGDDAAWVEALGWFAGWALPLCLSRSAPGP